MYFLQLLLEMENKVDCQFHRTIQNWEKLIKTLRLQCQRFRRSVFILDWLILRMLIILFSKTDQNKIKLHLKGKRYMLCTTKSMVSYANIFFCLELIILLEKFSFIWRCHRWRAANSDLCAALKAIEQKRFFIVPHLWLAISHAIESILFLS